MLFADTRFEFTLAFLCLNVLRYLDLGCGIVFYCNLKDVLQLPRNYSCVRGLGNFNSSCVSIIY